MKEIVSNFQEFLLNLRVKACRNNIRLRISYREIERGYIDKEDIFEIDYNYEVRRKKRWEKGESLTQRCRLADDDPDSIDDLLRNNADFIEDNLEENRNRAYRAKRGSTIYFIIKKAVGNDDTDIYKAA